MRQWWSVAVLAGLAFTSGCKPEVSDTGYVGTWARDVGEKGRSTISIVRSGEDYTFNWSLNAPEKKWKTECDGQGRCQEFVDGAKVADYVFTARMEPGTQRLVVECQGKVQKPKPVEVHYVDELVVEPGGLVLWSYTRERAGQRYEGNARPKHRFEKVSNEVAAP